MYVCVCVCTCTRVFPSQLREEIDKYAIKIYQYPDNDSDEDEELKRQDKELKVCCVLFYSTQSSILKVFNISFYSK